MKKKRFTEEQIIGALKEHDSYIYPQILPKNAVQTEKKNNMKTPALISGIAVVIALAVLLLLSVTLMIWAKPIADDYCFAGLPHDWLTYVSSQYHSWTGRWAGRALYGLFMPDVKILTWVYPALLFVFYCGYALAFYAVVRILFGAQCNRVRSLLLAVGLLAFYFAGMPGPGETIYWLTGSVEYSLPFLLCIFVFALLVAGTHTTHPTRRLAQTLLACMCAVVAPGFHEIAGIELTFVLAVATCVSMIRKTSGHWCWSATLVCAAIGTAVSVLAPGNSARVDMEGVADARSLHGLGTIIRVTIQQVKEWLIPWVTDVKLLAASLLLLASPWFREMRPEWARIRLLRIVILVTWLLAVGGAFLAVSVGFGRMGPARLYNLTYGIFLIGWLATLFVWSRDLAPQQQNDVTEWTRTLAGGVLAIALLSSTNAIRAIGDLGGEQNVRRYAAEMHERFTLLRTAHLQGEFDITLTDIPRMPESYFNSDLTGDADNWCNICIAKYFGLEKLRHAPVPR